MGLLDDSIGTAREFILHPTRRNIKKKEKVVTSDLLALFHLRFLCLELF